MITLPREIITGTLVTYLTHEDIINLSSVNVELRLLLGSYRFPYFINGFDPDHTNWKYYKTSTSPDNLSRPSTRLPFTGQIMTVYLGPMPVVFTPAPDTPISSRNLRHMKITSPNGFIPDAARWTGISFDSLISLAIPLFLGAEGTPEYEFMSKVYKSLAHGGGNNLRTLVLTDNYFTNKQLNKYILGTEIITLISSELLPILSTVRFPLVLENDSEDNFTPYDRSPLLCQLLTASAKHAIINSRGTPWQLGHSESRYRIDRCMTSTVENCICLPMTPTLTSGEYDELLSTADHSQNYIRIPEFFKPHLTVAFTNLHSLRTSKAASMSPLTSLQLFFPPPPLHSRLFAAITDLTLSLPEDQEELAMYQPGIAALPETFPSLSRLTLLLPHANSYDEFNSIANVCFSGLVLPNLQLHTLDVSARAIATRHPCGHGRMRFGSVKVEWLMVRDMVSCPECWDPLLEVGTRGIEVHGLLGVPQTEDDEEIMLYVLEGFGKNGREVNVMEEYVQWV